MNLQVGQGEGFWLPKARLCAPHCSTAPEELLLRLPRPPWQSALHGLLGDLDPAFSLPRLIFRICVCMCVYIYIHTYKHTHTHTRARTHTHTQTNINTYRCVRYSHIYICIHIYIYIYVCVCVDTYVSDACHIVQHKVKRKHHKTETAQHDDKPGMVEYFRNLSFLGFRV